MLFMLVNWGGMLLAALLVGSMFGLWLVLNPAGLSASAYVIVQQQGIRTLNRAMPVLGAGTILLTVTAAVAVRGDRGRMALMLVAAGCFVVAGLVTRLRNQPINAVVMTWKPDVPPATWTELRDTWWRWHVVRLAAGLVGLVLLIVTRIN